MSFVQSAEDIHRLRRYWHERHKPGQRLPLIIAKIEKPQALQNIDEIMAVRVTLSIVSLSCSEARISTLSRRENTLNDHQATDGVMVARGDLGVELSLEMVPMAQKLIIKKANLAHVHGKL